MGFGNPYGDPYNADIVAKFTDILVAMGINIISLADTIGVSDQKTIKHIYESLIEQYPQVEFGAHLHSHPSTAIEKIEAAYNAGCRRFDGAINGYGGCPMAKDDLVGNIATESIVSYLEKKSPNLGLKKDALKEALIAAPAIFTQYH